MKPIETSSSVDPRLHLCGSGMLLVTIFYVYQYGSNKGDAYTAIFSMASNLICFITSALCHSISNSRKKLLGFYFHLDRIGIILHIWATSLSASVLHFCIRYPFFCFGFLCLLLIDFGILLVAGCASATFCWFPLHQCLLEWTHWALKSDTKSISSREGTTYYNTKDAYFRIRAS